MWDSGSGFSLPWGLRRRGRGDVAHTLATTADVLTCLLGGRPQAARGDWAWRPFSGGGGRSSCAHFLCFVANDCMSRGLTQHMYFLAHGLRGSGVGARLCCILCSGSCGCDQSRPGCVSIWCLGSPGKLIWWLAEFRVHFLGVVGLRA